MSFQSATPWLSIFAAIVGGCGAGEPTAPTRAQQGVRPPIYQLVDRGQMPAEALTAPRAATTRGADEQLRPGGWGSPSYEEGDFVLRDVPLEKALATLAAHTRWQAVDFDADWEALSRVSITRQTRVSVSIWSPTVEKALYAILKSAAGAGGGESRIVFFPGLAGRIHITIRNRHLVRDAFTREYGIRDLLIDVPAGLDDLDEIVPPPVESGGLYGAPADQHHVVTRRERIVAIIRLIKETVDADSWKLEDACWIGADGDRLIIRQTEENHRAIANLFDQVRETRWSDPLRARVKPTTTQPTTRPSR